VSETVIRPTHLSAILVALACACGPAPAAKPAQTKASPAYVGRPAALFDDSIEPAAVGLDMERDYKPKADKNLRERALTADGIFRTRLSTVTKKNETNGSTYELALRSVEKLSGRMPGAGDTFLVNVQPASPALGIIRSFEARLVGKEFIAFVKTFSKEGGETEVHVHLAPSTNEVRAAISDAVALEAVQ
jgi:hypothetical protein